MGDPVCGAFTFYCETMNMMQEVDRQSAHFCTKFCPQQGCGVGDILNYGVEVGISKKVGVGISEKLGVEIFQILVVGVGD